MNQHFNQKYCSETALTTLDLTLDEKVHLIYTIIRKHIKLSFY